jgi:hypothetical protein
VAGTDTPLLPDVLGWAGDLDGLFWVRPVLFVVAVVVVWVVTRQLRVPTSTAPAVVASGHDPARPPATPVGRWNARVTQHGYRELHGDSGVIHLENGWLGFHLAGVPTPTWIVPTNRVRAGKYSVLSQAEVWIDSEETGRLNLTVSHEQIPVVVGYDLRNRGQRRHADEFLWLLHQSGARLERG